MKYLCKEIDHYNFLSNNNDPILKFNPEILHQRNRYLRSIEAIQLMQNDRLQHLEDELFKKEREYMQTRDEKLLKSIDNICAEIESLTSKLK